MKHSERFKNAMLKLHDVYHNNEIQKGDCSKCAVGIICSGEHLWNKVFMTSDEGQGIWMHNYNGVSKSIIDNTGYSVQELAKIENAFEVSTKYSDYNIYSLLAIDTDRGDVSYRVEVTHDEWREDMLKGINEVIVVLCEIENRKSYDKYIELFANSDRKQFQKFLT